MSNVSHIPALAETEGRTAAEIWHLRRAFSFGFWGAWVRSADEPVHVFLAITAAPSPEKQALSLGLLQGKLEPVDHALEGVLQVTDKGRELINLVQIAIDVSKRARHGGGGAA